MWKSLLKRWWYLFILAYFWFQMRRIVSEQAWDELAFFLLIVLGMALNFIVILLNGGMPASANLDDLPDEQRNRYRPMDETTRLSRLGDWIPVGGMLISPGDILLVLGAVGLIVLMALR